MSDGESKPDHTEHNAAIQKRNREASLRVTEVLAAGDKEAREKTRAETLAQLEETRAAQSNFNRRRIVLLPSESVVTIQLRKETELPVDPSKVRVMTDATDLTAEEKEAATKIHKGQGKGTAIPGNSTSKPPKIPAPWFVDAYFREGYVPLDYDLGDDDGPRIPILGSELRRVIRSTVGKNEAKSKALEILLYASDVEYVRIGNADLDPAAWVTVRRSDVLPKLKEREVAEKRQGRPAMKRAANYAGHGNLWQKCQDSKRPHFSRG